MHWYDHYNFSHSAVCLYLFSICGSYIILWNPTVFAELQYLKAGFIFALDMVTKFKMFLVL